jgi:very-short-patch-repair endonuclease
MLHKRTTPRIFHNAKALRRNLTPAERQLWARLQDHQVGGLGFRRQHALGPFIVDCVCPRQKYVIELDGESHANQPEYDARRTEWLIEQGYRVRRFTNDEVNRNIESVLQMILSDCGETPLRPSPSGTSPTGRE